MQIEVLGAGFAFGVSAFAVWLLVMLHHDRVHRLATAEASLERTRAHRRATLAAQHAPAATVPTASIARAGSFCRVAGNLAHDKHGAVLVCDASTKGRPRWRRAEVLSNG